MTKYILEATERKIFMIGSRVSKMISILIY